MSTVSIRFADPARDAARILAVYRPYIEQTAITFEYDVPGEAEFERRVADIAAHFPYLLLEVDGELAGYAYAHRQAERAAFGWNAELTIYLAEGWQGKGVGRPLYALLMRLLEMQGYVNFYGVITGSNAGSIALHERMGFEKIGLHERTGWKFNQWHDTVWMHRRAHDGEPGDGEPGDGKPGDGKPGEIVPVHALGAQAVAREIEAARAEIERRITKAAGA